MIIKERVPDSLKKTLTNVHWYFDQAIYWERELHSDIPTPNTELDSFKVVQDGDLMDNWGTTSQRDEA